MILTVDQLRKHIPDIGVEDEALRVLLDANEAAIEERAGPLAEVTETIYGNGYQHLLRLKTEAVSVVSVETGSHSELVALDTDEYRLEGAFVRREDNAAWGTRTAITYVPKNKAAERIITLVELVQCDLNFQPGMSAQSTGGWQESYSKDHLEERERILDRLSPRALFA